MDIFGGDGTIGDLRICFQATTLKSMTIIAEVKMVNGTLGLVKSTKYLTPYNGEMVKIIALDFKEVVKQMQSENDVSVNLKRIFYPLLLWLAVYCCLTPVVWVLDNFGDTVGDMPVIGPVIGAVSEFVEVLASVLICAVSCVCGWSCALLIMGVAWLFFRPLYGCGILLVFLCCFGSVIGIKHSQSGKPKLRGKRRGPKPDSPASMEMTGPGQPVDVCASPDNSAAMEVECPEGVEPGDRIEVTGLDGQALHVTVPDGISPGMKFMVQA